MFGFGKATCILCDQRVPRKEALAVRDYKGFAVCRRCVEQWRSNGGICPRCETTLRGAQQAGIFMEGKRSIGHADCGALSLMSAAGSRRTTGLHSDGVLRLPHGGRGRVSHHSRIPRGPGPDLAVMGSHHPAEYFAESIIHPNRVIVLGPGHTGWDSFSKMPSYADLMTVKQLIDVVACLKSLKAVDPPTAHDHSSHHGERGSAR